jgi:uncharacterized protein YdeI (YjbR/CyaY-like superfamily)
MSNRASLPNDHTRWKMLSQPMSKTNPKPAGKERVPRVPADIREVLAAAPVAKAQWMDLTPIGRRDFISWIDSAKQPETRKRRVESLPSRLAAGKRRPCCFSVVPFDLHKALASTPKAKAQWSDLDSMTRRDFIGWINSAKEPETRKRRIKETCTALAAGKHRVFFQTKSMRATTARPVRALAIPTK